MMYVRVIAFLPLHLEPTLFSQWNSGNDLSNDNSLICDCSSKWLNQWMKTRFLNSKVLCAEPEQFRGQEIRSLEEGSFGCGMCSSSM